MPGPTGKYDDAIRKSLEDARPDDDEVERNPGGYGKSIRKRIIGTKPHLVADDKQHDEHVDDWLRNQYKLVLEEPNIPDMSPMAKRNRHINRMKRLSRGEPE